MHGSDLSLALARTIAVSTPMVASLHPSDRHLVKDMLFQLPDLGQAEWETLAAMLEHLDEVNRGAVVLELRTYLAVTHLRPIAAYALERVFASAAQPDLDLAAIEAALEALQDDPPPGCLRHLGGLVEDSLMARLNANGEHPESLAGLRTMVRRRTEHWASQSSVSRLPGAHLDRLCLEGILIARVAHADGKVDAPEMRVCRDFLLREWGLGRFETEFVLNMSLADRFDSLDVLRVCRWYYEMTTEEERLAFLTMLFALAAVDGDLSKAEVTALMHVAADLRVEQEDFHRLFLAHGGIEEIPPLH